jgi:hypothetical protein
MRFARFSTIKSILSNVADLRMQSRHVVGVPMENRPAMTRRDVASELPHSKEGFDQSQVGTSLTRSARGPAVVDFINGSPTELRLFMTDV